MFGGTAASAEIVLASATGCPPLGAAALSVTVPVEVAPQPPEMLDGLRVSDVTVGPGSAVAADMNESATVSSTIDAARCRITAPRVGEYPGVPPPGAPRTRTSPNTVGGASG